MSTATLSFTLVFTPPGGVTNSASLISSIAAPYTAMSTGIMDIPDGTLGSPQEEFEIPFGSVSIATCLVIKNDNRYNMGLRLNDQVGGLVDEYRIPPGGMLAIGHPVSSSDNPVWTASITTTVLQVGAGYVQYFVYGT